MSTFRVQKTRDYTVMSNVHFRDTRLSLKAKGLLSFMLSLPEDWDYTERGLAATCSDGRDSLRSAIRELEKAGYLVRSRKRDSHGRLRDTEYIIYETPQFSGDPTDGGGPYDCSPSEKNIEETDVSKADGARAETKNEGPKMPVITENITYVGKSNTGDNGSSDHGKIPPKLDLPVLDFPTQVLYNVKSNTKRINTDIVSYRIENSIKHTDGTIWQSEYENCRRTVCDNIEYDLLKEREDVDVPTLSLIVDVIVRTICRCSQNSHVRVAKAEYPSNIVKQRLYSLDSTHIEYVLYCLGKNTTEVKAPDQYILAALYNAPYTIDSYYRLRFQHDSCGTKEKVGNRRGAELYGDSFDVEDFFRLAVWRGEQDAETDRRIRNGEPRGMSA